MIRLTVLGLVMGLASIQFAGAQCSGCGDDEGVKKAKKGSETNKVTEPSDKK
ncbi:MAG: hypothetical protein NTZ01_07780 [Verrucomicrobia bacterium]|nr:hypothetical protein [Verrucomicrobiota bacterium]